MTQKVIMKLWRGIVVGSMVAFFHPVTSLMVLYPFSEGSKDGLKMGLGGLAFYWAFGIWLYWSLSIVYSFMVKQGETRKWRYLKGLPLIVVGYFLGMIGHIIDGDWFWLNLKQASFFLLALPPLVEVEKNISDISVKSFTVAVCILAFQLLSLIAMAYFLGWDDHYHDIMTKVFDLTFFVSWAYWLLSYIYLSITKIDMPTARLYSFALASIIVGYVILYIMYVSREMVANAFMQNIRLGEILIFILSVPFMVELDRNVIRRKQSKFPHDSA